MNHFSRNHLLLTGTSLIQTIDFSPFYVKLETSDQKVNFEIFHTDKHSKDISH